MTLVVLPIDPRSVADARALLRETLEQHGVRAQPAVGDADIVEDAVLVLSELVTNAVRHTSALLRLKITVRDNTLHVAVADDAPGLPALLRDEEHHRTGGRGLTIVNALADRWGFTTSLHGKTVWFDMELR